MDTFSATGRHQRPMIDTCRLHEVIARAVSDVIRSNAEDELFNRTSERLLELPGLDVAWIGLRDLATARFTSVAAASRSREGSDVLRGIALSTGESERLLRRISGDSCWRMQAPDAGWQSVPEAGVAARIAQDLRLGAVAFFPLRSEYTAHGLVILGATDRGFFEDGAMDLLGGLVGDMGLRLNAIGKADRYRNVEQLGEEAARGRQLFFDQAPDAIVMIWSDRIEVNEGFGRMFRVASPRLGSFVDLQQFFMPALFDDMLEFHRRRIAGRAAPHEYQSVGVRADGTAFPVLVRVPRARPVSGPHHVMYITDLSAVLG